MTTTMPGAVDVFTNPGSGTKFDQSAALYHDVQHDQLNDGLLAVERIVVGPTWYNAKSDVYGCKGDGVTDDRVGLRAVCDAVRVAGGGRIYLPAGTYMYSLAAHPINAGYSCGPILGSNTLLMGAGRGVTVLKMLANQTDQKDALLNYSISSGGDQNITIQDITFDGNAANQTGTQNGLHFLRASGISIVRVVSLNHRGTAMSGVHETFQVEFGLCGDCSVVDCQAIGNAGSTASGFSADQSTGLFYANCLAKGMTITNGFTHNNCAQVSHTNCWSILNGSHGFNSEVSFQVVYAGCHAGGLAVNSAGSTPYPYTDSQNLGNTSDGFVISGATDAYLVGCIANRNANGIWVTTSTGTRISACSAQNNTNFGITTLDAATSQSTVIDNNCQVLANTTAQYNIQTLGYVNRGAGGLINPALPATTVNLTNPYPWSVMIVIFGGTVTAIQLPGGATGLTSGTFILAPGQAIQLTYTVAPTWRWYAV